MHQCMGILNYYSINYYSWVVAVMCVYICVCVCSRGVGGG